MEQVSKGLGRKQSVEHEDFVRVMRNIEQIVPREVLEAQIELTVAEISRVTRSRRVGYAWSGGKDSIVLRGICERAGITHCCFGMTNLEFPAFLQWVTNHMPPELEVFNNGWDLQWLTKHPEMLFPRNSSSAAKWFQGVNHSSQVQFFKRHNLEMILLGRRKVDGNFVGRDGVYRNASGVLRYSPLRDWSHEMVLAYLHYYRCPLPPCYGWPRGYRVGTGSWPARQWCRDIRHGWSEVYQIDPTIVREAARYFISAGEYLQEVE